MAEKLIEVTGLSVLREVPILRDIDWTVRAGERWVILGPNGCGKTSLLNAVYGYLSPSKGTVTVFEDEDEDACLDTWDQWRKSIGLVSNHLAFRIEPDEPVLDVVKSGRHAMLNYWVHRPPVEDHDLALKLLKRIGALPLADRPWAWLSQGEKQRILVGRALMTDPLRLLVLDEPCSGLDPVARERFLAFLGRVIEQKRHASLGTVLVTHHVEEILPCFTHALLLRQGRRVASGEIGEVMTPRNLSETFHAPVKLRRAGDRYRLDIVETGKRVF